MKEKIIGLLCRQTGLNKIEISNLIEQPKRFGDYAFPCFVLAKKFGKDPKSIAIEITNKIKKEKPGMRVESIGGYINFYIDKITLASTVINEVLQKKEKYGSSNYGKGEKVLIEHTSLNPNSSPHVGRIRNALIGYCLVKLYAFQGYETEVHYYVNDVGKQIALLILGCKGNETFEKMLNLYIKMAKKLANKEVENKVFELLRKLEEGDTATKRKFKKIVQTCVKGQEKILSGLGIKYDFFDYESRYLRTAKLKAVLKKLSKTGKLFKDSEGRLVLNQKGYDFEHEMRQPYLVLTRNDGTGLYPLRDIVYNIDKLARAKNNIIVLGEDQKLYHKQIKAALSLLGYNAPRVMHYSFMLIATPEGKQRMSTRKGELVLLTDFLDEAIKKAIAEIRKRKIKRLNKKIAKAIALAAVKYSILKIEENKNVLFDWKESLNFEGNSGPYLQYTYARASSILRKVKSKEKTKPKDIKEKDKDQEEKEIALIKQLSLFPNVVKNAALQLKPHLVANYTFDLCKAFNEFYAKCPVIKAPVKIRLARIALVKATRQVLANALVLIGIEKLERM